MDTESSNCRCGAILLKTGFTIPLGRGANGGLRRPGRRHEFVNALRIYQFLPRFSFLQQVPQRPHQPLCLQHFPELLLLVRALRLWPRPGSRAKQHPRCPTFPEYSAKILSPFTAATPPAPQKAASATCGWLLRSSTRACRHGLAGGNWFSPTMVSRVRGAIPRRWQTLALSSRGGRASSSTFWDT